MAAFTYTNTLTNGTTADADEVMANFNDVKGHLEGATGGQLLIANSSGDIVAQTMSGDATMSDAGALTIANDAVETAMIADDAVTVDKITFVTQADSDDSTAVGTSYGSYSSISCAAGTWLLNASISIVVAGADTIYSRVLAGALPGFERSGYTPNLEAWQEHYCWRATFGTTTTVAIQGKRNGAGTSAVADSMITGLRVA